MKIIIEYESTWRNSFLDGTNNEPLPKGGRNFVASMTSLRKSEKNFKKWNISKDTVMGVLNRLIGDQRKLYQSRQDENYYFRDIEENLLSSHILDNAIIDNELVFLRNISGSTDQSSFTGMIKTKDPAFTSSFSKLLWGVFFLEIDQVIDLILNNAYEFETSFINDLDPLIIIERLEKIQNLKSIELKDDYLVAYEFIKKYFNDVDFKLIKQDKFNPVSFYASALYLQIERLQNYYDLSSIFSKQGGISGISKRGFTKKDFMDRFTTGKKKLIWGNPFILKQRKKGEGELVQVLTKASGCLEIILDISYNQAVDLNKKITDAGVSSFYLGKKGLAYVSDIRI